MTKGRLEAFSDGVIAIVLTIMVLELKVPHGEDFSALAGLWPVFLSYVLSFMYIGVYWSNHHHLFQAVQRVNGPILWANLHLLFWLSLIPFVTGWMGENGFAPLAVSLYGFVQLMASIAYFILSRALIAENGSSSTLARAIGRDFKGKVSTVIYLGAIIIACALPWVAMAAYVGVLGWWLIPDRRIEKTLAT